MSIHGLEEDWKRTGSRLEVEFKGSTSARAGRLGPAIFFCYLGPPHLVIALSKAIS